MNYNHLKLTNQLCHPLYSAANAIVRAYDPHLKEIDLTYPQYLVMMALWEKDGVRISDISNVTYIDSGSMTPILKKLIDKKFIAITPSKEDGRQKVVSLTKKGENLKDKALNQLPELSACFTALTNEEMTTLKKILSKLFVSLTDEKNRA